MTGLTDTEHPNCIAILDCGGQYAKVVDRKIRELKVKTDILPLSTPKAVLESGAYAGIILTGGPKSVYSEDAYKGADDLFSVDLPILGICYGMQLMNLAFGGNVSRKTKREDSERMIAIWRDAEAHPAETVMRFQPNRLFDMSLSSEESVLLTHGDSVGADEVAADFRIIAMSNNVVVGLQHRSRPYYGVQFHPEVDLSVNGKAMLANFAYAICKCTPSFTLPDRISACIHDIQEYIRTNTNNHAMDYKIISLVSGGVDSSVCTALLSKVVPLEAIIAIHVDHGFMRKNESNTVKQALAVLGVDLHVLSVQDDFLSAKTTLLDKNSQASYLSLPLSQSVEPEEKRMIIGDTFIKVVDTYLKETLGFAGLSAAAATAASTARPLKIFLVQGSLRTDLIESASSALGGSSKADTIKTHHNDTTLVRNLRAEGSVIEPLKDYHKDEVREIGRQLSLPDELVDRHPFPGPGLAIRILCANTPHVTPCFLNLQESLDKFVSFCLGATGSSTDPDLYNAFFDACGTELATWLTSHVASHHLKLTLLPVKAVGVQGDGRTYSYMVGITSEIEDLSMIHWAHLSHFAKIIPRLFSEVNRVAFVFGGHLRRRPKDIVPTFLSVEVIDNLREVDAIVQTTLGKFKLTHKLSQVPVALLPVNLDCTADTRRAVVIRTIITSDFMTGIVAIPGVDMPIAALEEIVAQISEAAETNRTSRVLYDLTGKPPSCVEYE